MRQVGFTGAVGSYGRVAVWERLSQYGEEKHGVQGLGGSCRESRPECPHPGWLGTRRQVD